MTSRVGIEYLGIEASNISRVAAVSGNAFSWPGSDCVAYDGFAVWRMGVALDFLFGGFCPRAHFRLFL